MTALKLTLAVRAFKIRMKNGETFEEIAASYPKISEEELELIKGRLGIS